MDPQTSSGESTASLCNFVEDEFDGAGLRIAEILPRGPLGDAEFGIEPGMVIETIDGRRAAELLWVR